MSNEKPEIGVELTHKELDKLKGKYDDNTTVIILGIDLTENKM